jgi:hypothetical protein
MLILVVIGNVYGWRRFLFLGFTRDEMRRDERLSRDVKETTSWGVIGVCGISLFLDVKAREDTVFMVYGVAFERVSIRVLDKRL